MHVKTPDEAKSILTAPSLNPPAEILSLNTKTVIEEIKTRRKIEEMLRNLVLKIKQLKVVKTKFYGDAFMHKGSQLILYVSDEIYNLTLLLLMQKFAQAKFEFSQKNSSFLLTNGFKIVLIGTSRSDLMILV